MWNDGAKRVAINVIGTVESNLTYDAINYSESIVIGFAQWYSTRAAQLLATLRGTPAWTGVTSRVTNAIDNNDTGDGTFWSNFWLNRADGQSLQPVLVSPEGIAAQNSQFLDDLDDYAVAASVRGLDRDTDTASFIYFAQLYHFSPRYANQVLDSAAPDYNLERLDSLARNHFYFSRYGGRLSTAKHIIDEWDDELPEEFEPTDPIEGGDGGGNIEQIRAALSAVHMVGSQLHLHTSSGIVVCEPTSSGLTWIPGSVGAGPDIPPPVDPNDPVDPLPPGSDAEVTAQAIRQFLLDRVEQYDYRQAPGRLTPDSSGFTDCSALLYYAYRSVVGDSITESSFGTWTVAQNQRGRNIRSFQSSIVPESLLQVGDLVFYSRDSARVRHVEMYIGNGQLIGWGGNRSATPSGKGPYVKPNYVNYYNTFASGTVWSSARRHLPDF